MTRLLDLGIKHIQQIVMDMSRISGDSVLRSIESYEKNVNVKEEIFEWSEMLRVMQDEVADLTIELIARYQPIATDLRFIRSCMDFAYGFSRYGRYSFDIVEVLETIGSVSECDKGAVLMMANTVREMILLSINGLQARDKTIAGKLSELDDTADSIYRTFFKGPYITYPRKRAGGHNDECINKQFRS